MLLNNSSMNSEISPETAQKKTLPTNLIGEKDFLFNRELSWLEFNSRVLDEALDTHNPLLERLKFAAIFSTNLDEFFMIRVSGLQEQIAEGISKLSPDGMTADEQLNAIRRRVEPLIAAQMRCLQKEIFPSLAENGIEIVHYENLSGKERTVADRHFTENVFPILTPQAVDASHPFPFISNLSLNLGVFVRPRDGGEMPGRVAGGESLQRFARIKIPPTLSRLVYVGDKGGKQRFTLLGELIRANLAALFIGMDIEQVHFFRLTRDADIELREDEAGDLLRTIENEIRQRRRFTMAARLEISETMSDEMTDLLAKAVGVAESDIYRIGGFMNVPDLMQLYDLDLPHLKDKPLQTVVPAALETDESVFDSIRRADILLHHPFDNFSAVADFVKAAADDKDVQAIKVCLYRTGKDSPIIKALVRAVEKGKQVAALVELKARFDEENNIEWARRLESAGVHVVYGMRGLKTHCKLTLVVRRENNALKRYVHVATGNYNRVTSRIYTDLGLLTADEQIGADATDLFNYLTGFSAQTEYRKLLIAPVNLRKKMLDMIKRETAHGTKGRIIAKVNSLTDEKIIRELYAASQNGVQIDLIVRGICALRPATKGLSENIRVRSIVGRFLEHSRVFYFGNNGADEIYIGSADWMQRNLDRRVEAAAPISDPKLKNWLRDVYLKDYLQDTAKTRILQPDGVYKRPLTESKDKNFSVQDSFIGKRIS